MGSSLIIPVLAIAGSLARKARRRLPPPPYAHKEAAFFVGLVVGVVLIVGG